MANSDPAMTEGGKSSEYVVVARRYRPQSFEDLVGQGTVSRALCNALTTDRVGHAYLFTGARGVGKTSTARILAKALNCIHGPTTTPCGVCDICQQIAAGDDVDVLEIDGASNRGIDEIRQLRSNVGIRPSRTRFKIYIIDEVHMLTKEAFNALLKTLEEPPEHVKFVFCTTEPGRIPVTVLSRCQRFDFAPVRTAEIVTRLRYIVQQEGAEAELPALELLARRAAGSMRDSQSLLEQLLSFVSEPITVAHVHSMLGTASDDRLRTIVQSLINRDAAQALAGLDQAVSEGVDVGQLAEQLVGSLRDLMAAAVGVPGELLLFHAPQDIDSLKDAARAWGLETLLAAAQILDQAVARMRHSVHGRVLLELALVRVAHLERLDDLALLAQQIGKLQGQDVIAVPSDGSTTHKKKVQPAESSLGRTADAEGDSGTDSHENASLAEAMRATVEARRRIDAPQASPPGTRPESARMPVTARVVEKPATGSTLGTSSSSSSETRAFRHLESTEGARDESSPLELTPSTRLEDGPSANVPPPSASTDSADIQTTESINVTESTGQATGDASALASSPKSTTWTPSDAQRHWRAALAELNDMTAEHAGMADAVAILGPNRLVVRFKQVYNSSKQFCERPEKRQALEAVLQQVVGQRVHLEFELLGGDAPRPVAVKPTRSRQQQRQQATRHPFVQQAMEMFGAEIMNVDVSAQRADAGRDEAGADEGR